MSNRSTLMQVSPAVSANHAPVATDWRHSVRSFAGALAMMLPFLGGWAWFMYSDWKKDEDARQAVIWASKAYERLIAAPPAESIPVAAAVHGREIFMTTCATCHAPNGRGLPGLGMNLVESPFIAGRDDAAMVGFLLEGRMSALPLPMPPKGGREDLTEADLKDVVTYLRGAQDPRRMPTLPEYVAAAPTPPSETEKTAALAAAGGDAELAGYIASGTKIFNSTCIACHGKGGVGIKGNGKALANNDFIKGLDDDGLLAFVKSGRGPTDPKNTTGVQMPPKGGNPALSDDDLLDVISYLRTLQATPANAGAVTQGK